MATLRVFPNPWSAPLDKHGSPCGICPRDPDSDGGGPGQYVGARVDRKRTVVLQKLEAYDRVRSARQNTFYEYLGIASDDAELGAKLAAKEPVEVPKTPYYKDRLRDGSLIAADEETARIAKVRFVAPATYFGQFVKPAAEAPAAEVPAASDEAKQVDAATEEPVAAPAAAPKKSSRSS